jgi:hypothetical protein
MASKLNLGIKNVYDLAKKTGRNVENTASSLKDDLETKVISIQKSKMPFLSRFRIKSSEFLKNHKADVKYLLLIIPIIAIFLLVKAVQYRQSLNSRAGIHQASVAFQLQNWNLPPENPFEVWINSDSPVSFANISISFNPALVKLTHEIALSGRLAKIIKVTTMSEANSTGVVSIVVGLDPTMVNSPPVGAFQVATLIFNANTQNPNITAMVNFNSSQMQIVASDQSAFQLTIANLNLVLNPTATPSPSPIPTLSPTPIPTPTRTPSTTPTPTQNDIIPPLVNITAPVDGLVVPTKGSLSIRTTASDASGIATIIISLDGKTSKTCTGATSCQTNLAVNKLSAGSHTITATATDKSINKNTSSKTIYITK